MRPHPAIDAEDTTMAKSQLRSTKEPKKPKKQKQAVVQPSTQFISQPTLHQPHKAKH